MVYIFYHSVYLIFKYKCLSKTIRHHRSVPVFLNNRLYINCGYLTGYLRLVMANIRTLFFSIFYHTYDDRHDQMKCLQLDGIPFSTVSMIFCLNVPRKLNFMNMSTNKLKRQANTSNMAGHQTQTILYNVNFILQSLNIA